jgi:hypothetical protein
MKAFLFTNLADRRFAHLCRKRALSLGIEEVTVVVDGDVEPAEGEIVCHLPAKHPDDKGTTSRLYGTEAAKTFLDTYLWNTVPGDTIIRLEADILLFEPAVNWFRESKGKGIAHGYRLGGLRWCGCWAADRECVEKAREEIETMVPCETCGGCLMSYAFKKTSGIRRPWPEAAQFFQRGKHYGANTHFLVLPHGLRGEERAKEMQYLHSTPVGAVCQRVVADHRL